MLCFGVPLLLLVLWRPIVWAVLAESSHSIPVPQNLTIKSYNFENKLRWSPVRINGSVSYTVESFVIGHENWEEVVNCTNIAKPECDFVFKDFYKIILRVRAQQGELKSNWTTMPSHFQGQENTTLGPPKNIKISAGADSLLISFEHPFSYTALPSSFRYFIYYWDNSTETNLTLDTSHTKVTLKNLKQRTVYCLRIQTVATFTRNLLKGQLSAPYCKATTITDATKILYITLIFGFVVFILIAVFLCLMAVRKYQDAIKSLWHPPLTIPFHFEEDLQNSQIIIAEFKNSVGEEHWDTLSVISNAEESLTVANGLAMDKQD